MIYVIMSDVQNPSNQSVTKHQTRATNHINYERKNPERFKPKRRNSKSQTYQSLKYTPQGQISFENQKMMRADTIKKGQKTCHTV